MQPKYIAKSGSFIGEGKTAEEAVQNLQDNAIDYDGDFVKVDDISVYEVIRAGKATITVTWESE